MFKSIACFAAAVAVACSVSSAQAATASFDNRVDFLAAGGAATDYATPAFSQAGPTPVTFGGLSISSVSGSFFTTPNSPSGIPNAILFSDVAGENFNVGFDDLVFGFGFDVLEPISAPFCNTAVCAVSTFSVGLFNDANMVGSATFSPTRSDTVAAFFGIQSTFGFNSVQIREIIGTNDNEHFGNFVTTVAAIPLPAPFLMLLAGLGALGLVRYRSATA